ncbi:hypothetical protein NQ318_010688 [Aromia moschata]|uniref:Uncharacterized protein n=1 Tax=Aromia moschata TaxID=1265417 RepID=A0AAV8XP46_9CUCU|nr:hypothetical protein NQ318_010688 [Aromia moschata]
MNRLSGKQRTEISILRDYIDMQRSQDQVCVLFNELYPNKSKSDKSVNGKPNVISREMLLQYKLQLIRELNEDDFDRMATFYEGMTERCDGRVQPCRRWSIAEPNQRGENRNKNSKKDSVFASSFNGEHNQKNSQKSRMAKAAVLTLKDFSLNEEYVICESCADSIYTFFEFKSVCLYSEDHMVPFIRTMNGTEVDIIEVAYLKENPSAATVSDSNDAVCRLCLKRDRCVDLNVFSQNFADNIVAKCIPEVDIKSTRDPKICLSCQTSLLNYYQFITECLAKQENIMECDDRKAIKSEELDIKTEEEECDGNTDEERMRCLLKVLEIKSYVDISYKQEKNHKFVNWDPNQNGNEIKLEYPKDHKLIEDVAIRRYHCYHCPYVTKRKGDLARHVLIHRKSPRLITYDCSLCSYKSKQKGNLTTHMLIHKDISEVPTYQCALCPYKAKRKRCLILHFLIHQDASKVTSYQCALCPYKAKFKSYLYKHTLIHQDVSNAITYECSFCFYNTKRRSYLTKHMLIHKNTSEVTTYRCTLCPYKARRKSHLTRHFLLIHQGASEVATYDCSLCSYKSKHKKQFKKTHADS